MSRGKNEENSVVARRGHGEGQLFQRGDSWCARISLGYGPDGSRIRRTFSAPTKKEVQAKVRSAIQAHEQGLSVRSEALTVKKLMDDWLELIVKPSLRPRTYDHYALMSRAHIVPGLGRHKVSRLDVQTVQAFLHEKQQSGLSAGTIVLIRSTLRNALNHAIRWEMVSRNVAALASPPKKREKPACDFTEEQARALRSAFAKDQHCVFLNLLLGVGLRLGEGLGLRWEDVFLDDESGPRIRVQFQLQQIDGYKLTTPKTNASRRTIHIPNGLAHLLRAHRKHQDEVMKPRAGERWSNEWGLVFTNLSGGPLDDARVRKNFKALLASQGIELIRLHDLRHMCATLLLARGVHPKIVQNLLGHEDFSVTMNVYSHVQIRDMKSAADAMNAALGYDE